MARRRIRLRKSDVRCILSKAVHQAKDAREVGGLLIDNGCFLHLRETRNLSRRRGSFRLDLREVNMIRRASEKLDLTIAGTFHSHICWFAKPGEADIRGAEDDSLMLIIDSMDRDIRLWRIKNDRAYPVTFVLI